MIIENTHVNENRKEVKMDKKEYENFLDIIKPIKTLMSLHASPSDGMQAVIDLAKKFGIKRICVFLKDEKEEMMLACGYPPDKHGLKSKKSLTDHPALKEIIEKKFMLLIKNPSRDPRSGCTPEFCKEYGINANLFIRLEINSEPIGVIVIDAVGEKKEFSKYDIMMAKEIALLATKEYHNRKRIESEEIQNISDAIAAAVAHELRNPIMTIGGFAKRLKKETQKEKLNTQKTKEYSSVITEEAKRIERLLKNVINLLLQKAPNLQRRSLNKVVKEIIEEVKKETKTKIPIHFDIKGKLPLIYIDRGQIKIIVWQILKNALDEIEEDNKEEIFIRTWKKPRVVCLEITNTGSYIKEENLTEIFSPFYTKKTRSGKLGLGLAIAQKLIKAHGGHIKVRSQKEPQPMTTFRCVFPVKKPKR